MIDLFQYNWQIRDDWFVWCDNIAYEELIKTRTGGMGSIIHNLFHVIDCEQIWVNQMKGTPVIIKDIKEIRTIDEVKAFSEQTKYTTKSFIESLSHKDTPGILEVKTKKGKTVSYTYDKLIKHIVSHEIHHIGQISVWSREIGLKPVSSDLLFRDL
ncbi:DinB family protein [Pseudalkalibacillus sp. JSM 102089]|uniref:DinB family protein n=1 Tax=Pseudalkalibacillus sp. JSM 102089 TaxID=3229856 RepID=UPI0035259678